MTTRRRRRRGTTRQRSRTTPATRMRAGDGTGGYHPHESPLTMLVPLVAAVASARCSPGFVFHGFHRARARRAPSGTARSRSSEHADARDRSTCRCWVKLSPTIVDAARPAASPGTPISATRASRRSFVAHVRAGSTTSCSTNGISTSCTTSCSSAPPSRIGRLFWKRGDERTIDRFGPNGAAGWSSQRQPRRSAAAVGLSLLPMRW